MACQNYVDCTNVDQDWINLFKSLIVIVDGELYLKTNNCVGGGGTVCSDAGTFTNADLVGNVLLINHDCGSLNVASISIIDPTGVITPTTGALGDLAGLNQTNNVTVDFGAPLGAGTYRYVIVTV